MDYFEVTVYGIPGPQGSKKDTGRRRTSKAGNRIAIMIESSKKVAPWRAAVVAAAELVRPAEPFDGPLVAGLVFTMPRPESHWGTGRNEGALKPRFVDAVPDRVPDLSKLIRSTEDALTTAGVWVDDARVVGYDRPRKVYVGDPNDPDALDRPGAVIRVRRFVTCSREQHAHVLGDVRGDVPLFVLAEPRRGPS